MYFSDLGYITCIFPEGYELSKDRDSASPHLIQCVAHWKHSVNGSYFHCFILNLYHSGPTIWLAVLFKKWYPYLDLVLQGWREQHKVEAEYAVTAYRGFNISIYAAKGSFPLSQTVSHPQDPSELEVTQTTHPLAPSFVFIRTSVELHFPVLFLYGCSL